uniref:DDRGK domain-containing protein 1 n=1 Tax=Cacopsylla melanoneura TaxID=428564 RepID=A0A8D8XER2_9HEMI
MRKRKTAINEDVPLPGTTQRMNALLANRNNARSRMRAARTGNSTLRSGASGGDEREDNEEGDEDNDAPNRPVLDIGDKKVGTKKLAKLEAKAAKKAQREQDQQERADKKKQQEKDEEEQKKQRLKEEEEERKREEEEKRIREEKEARELEEYMKLKQAFSVEEEGYDEIVDEEEEKNLLERFITHIQQNKVVVMEDLAAQFKMKTQSVIDRIVELQKTEALTGVIDDRGKFIYISQNELNSVATFIKQRGRVSVSELVENSNQLVTLIPDQVTA